MPLRNIGCPKCNCFIPAGDIVRHALTCGFAPPQLVKLAWKKWCDDRRHSALAITTTAANDCPRRFLINRLLDYDIMFDKMLPSTIGDAFHQCVAEMGCADECSELQIYSETCTCLGSSADDSDLVEIDGVKHDRRVCGLAKCSVAGKVFGIPLTGLIDSLGYLRNCPDRWKAWDWKTQSAFSDKYLTNQLKPEHRVQGLINASLARQSGINVVQYDFAIIPWSRCVTISLAIPETQEEIEDELSRLTPYGGMITAREILEVEDASIRLINGGMDVRELLKQMPLYGQQIALDAKGGSMCSKFCSVNSICWELGSTSSSCPPVKSSPADRYGF